MRRDIGNMLETLDCRSAISSLLCDVVAGADRTRTRFDVFFKLVMERGFWSNIQRAESSTAWRPEQFRRTWLEA